MNLNSGILLCIATSFTSLFHTSTAYKFSLHTINEFAIEYHMYSYMMKITILPIWHVGPCGAQ